MCLVLYMASAKRRPLVPWDQKAPRFHVTGEDADARKARVQFTKKRVHYVGSEHGCGCGFRQESDIGYAEPETLASKRDNHRSLHDYVEACLADEDFIELFSCWSGDEADAAESSRDVTLEDLLQETFFFSEMQLTRVFGTVPSGLTSTTGWRRLAALLRRT
jgi:hypothetical protein